MDDLFPESPITLQAQIKCVERELVFRRRVYGKQLAKGTMTRAQSDREIALMEAVLKTLRGL